MLTFRACLNDLRLDGRHCQSVQDATSLDVFKHHLITDTLMPLTDGVEIWVGEAADPFGAVEEYDDRARKTTSFVDFDGIRVNATGGRLEPRVTVSRTAGGTSPLYVSANKSRICISWKFEEAVALLENPQPNVEICRLILKHGKGQTREQIIQGVFALWPGESMVFDSEGLKFSICENIAVVLPSTFSDRARATDAFLDAVAAVLQPLLSRSKRPLLEFSGGMDSTCVALAASSVRTGLESYGVIHPGAVGRQQRMRREELIEMLGLIDYTGSSSSTLPVQSLRMDECQVTPNDDVYRMCLMDTLQTHELQGVDMVMSGIGGDELAKDFTFWRHEWELPGHASRSSIVGSMSRADMFMRRGIWPVNPLTHPSVVNLCRAMPATIRQNRLFNRFAIARAGLSDGYMNPRYHETFANVLMLEAIECDFDQFLDTSILGDFGVLDVSRLLAKTHAKTELGVPIKLVGKMYYTIKLEMVLRRYVR